MQILSRVKTGKPIALVEHVPTLPHAVQDAVLRALSKDPELRFASIAEFADQLAKAANIQLTSYGPHPPTEESVSGTSVTQPAPPNNPSRHAKTKPQGVNTPRDRRRNTRGSDAEERLPTPKMPVRLVDAGAIGNLGSKVPAHQGQVAQVSHKPRDQAQPPTVRAAHARLRAPAAAAGQPTSMHKVESGRLRRYSKPKFSSERPAGTSSKPRVDTGAAKAESEAEVAALRSVLESIKKNVAQGERQQAIANARSALKMAQSGMTPALSAALTQAEQLLTPILLRAIGGPTQVLATSICDPSAQDTSLSPQHMFLLSRIGSSMTTEELLDITPLSALETLGLVLDFIDQGYLIAK